MKAGGVGCADNRCQNNKPNEFGLNGKWRQVFCNREKKKWEVVWKNRESKQVVNWNGKGKKIKRMKHRLRGKGCPN